MVARCDAPRRTLCPTAWLVRAVRERHAFEKPGSRRTGFLFARFSNRSEPSRETGLKARSVRHVAPAFGKAKAPPAPVCHQLGLLRAPGGDLRKTRPEPQGKEVQGPGEYRRRGQGNHE